MADSRDPTPPYSPNFSFNPTPQGMSPDQLYGFFSSMTPEQRQAAQAYWGSQAGTSVPQSTVTTAVPTPQGTALPSPQGSQPPTPRTARSSTARRRASRGSSSGGGGCCGGSATDASTPPRSRRGESSVESTPRGSPHTAWGAHNFEDDKVYSCRDGAPIMDDVGKEMRQRVRQLCTIQFGHSVLTHWDDQDTEKKNYINEKIREEFRPQDPNRVVSNDWIQHTAMMCMSHRRSDARQAYKHGKPKPVWLDREEWDMIVRESTETPDKYQQQREAARARLQSAGTSHLGSGGYETLRAEFELLVKRPPTRQEEKYGFKHSPYKLYEKIEEDGEFVDWDALS